jgi:hypothetical protein
VFCDQPLADGRQKWDSNTQRIAKEKRSDDHNLSLNLLRLTWPNLHPSCQERFTRWIITSSGVGLVTINGHAIKPTFLGHQVIKKLKQSGVLDIHFR